MLPANIKEKIISSYAINNQGEIELEARFGLFRNGNFTPGVSRQVFNRIKDYFDKASKDIIHVNTTDYIMGRVRKSVINPEGEEVSTTIWITKNRLWDMSFSEYGIRYSMSSEIPIKPIDNANFVPEFIREKSRSSYFVFGKAVRIDITLVTSNSIGKRETGNVSYEVEIELLDRTRLADLEKAIGVTVRLVLDTIVLYNDTLRNQVVNEVNSILGSNKRGFLDHYPLVQARNLKLRDMVFGGLIGNENTGFSCTNKADGQRKMLVFLDSGIWLVSAPNNLMRITESGVPTLTGTILDGEMIPADKRLTGAPKTRVWFLAFDALAWSRDRSISNEPHARRMYYAQSVADIIKGDVITVNTKSFKSLSTPQEFFTVMREMFREQLLLPYKQDGFMFTPQYGPYNPHSDNHPLHTRVLTRYSDVCKWKPQEELTIDFLIKWRADATSPIGRNLDLYVNLKGSPVIFRPAIGKINVSHPLTLNLPNNTIVEYAYNYETNLLVPTRIRHDKDKPNKLDIAEDVWSDIFTPIERSTMEGNNFTLLRRYHNRIKRELFTISTREIDNSTLKRTQKSLLDIGSGRGGDINKWKDFDRIVAVEPNAEHILEMRRRLDEATGDLKDLKNRVFILQAGGEETEKINNAVNEWIGEKVNVISSMLSLTFFWQNSSLVNALCNTIISNIKPGGSFIFLTMDGDLVEQTFEPAFGTGPILNKLTFGDIATLEYFSDVNPKSLHIHIQDSIVTDQTEWLVRLNDLETRLPGFNFTLRKKADEEKFLTEEEITMTQMYTYGIMKHDGSTPLKLISLVPVPVSSQITSPGVSLVSTPLPAITSPISTPLPSITSKLPAISTPLPPITSKLLPITSPISTPLPSITSPISTPLPPITSPISPITSPISTPLPPITSPISTPLPSITSPALPQITTLKLPKINLPKREKEVDMLKMDVVEKIRASWWSDEGSDEENRGQIVRIGSVADGSCLIHALLNAYLEIYQTNPNVKFRKNFAKNLRRDISFTLELPDPNFPNVPGLPQKTRYETAADGQFVNLYAEQLLGLKFEDVYGQNVDFSLKGLQKLFNSSANLGDEMYSYISDLLNIDIYIMRLTNKDLYLHVHTSKPGRDRRSVVIAGSNCHYETIGIFRGDLIQTFFEANDPFIVKIRTLLD
jgi:hypothetical protein